MPSHRERAHRQRLRQLIEREQDHLERKLAQAGVRPRTDESPELPPIRPSSSPGAPRSEMVVRSSTARSSAAAL